MTKLDLLTLLEEGIQDGRIAPHLLTYIAAELHSPPQELAPEAVEAIEQAWSDNLVLRFRGQRLDDDQLMRFSAHFGELDLAPVIAAARVKVPGEDRYVESAEEGARYISIISNIIENGKAIGALGAYESIWHTDMSYNPEPPCASALYALEVPPAGGTSVAPTSPLASCRRADVSRGPLRSTPWLHAPLITEAGMLTTPRRPAGPRIFPR